MWSVLVFFSFDALGFVTIAHVIPESIACRMEENYWFIVLWPTNISNRAILEAAPGGNLNACRMISATAWSAAVGIAMFFIRALFELYYNERRNFLKIKAPIMLFSIGMFAYLPNPFNPTIIDYGRRVFSINIHFPRIVSETELLAFSFGTFFILSECFAVALVYTRSKIDARSSARRSPVQDEKYVKPIH
jgi:hypothetical protein